MRRLRQFLAVSITVLSAGVLLLSAVLCWRSYTTVDDWIYTCTNPGADASTMIMVSSFVGRTQFDWNSESLILSPAEHAERVLGAPKHAFEHRTSPTSAYQSLSDPAEARQFDFHLRSRTVFGPRISSYPASWSTERMFDLPYWAVICAAVIAPSLGLVSLVRHWLRRHRNLRGCCLRCGYDMRATPRRCPECGWTVESGTGTFDVKGPAHGDTLP